MNACLSRFPDQFWVMELIACAAAGKVSATFAVGW